MHLKVKVFSRCFNVSRCYNVLKQMPGLTFTSSLRQGVFFSSAGTYLHKRVRWRPAAAEKHQPKHSPWLCRLLKSILHLG